MATACLVAMSTGCARRPDEPAREKITIGVPRDPLAALLILAVDQGYFAQQGLDVTIVDTYPSGARAMEGMFQGEVEMTVAADVPIVLCSFDRKDFAVLATLGSSANAPRIVARKSAGIRRPEDLRGKRIATQKASAVHYFLHLFLMRHGIPEVDVRLSFARAEDLPQTLASGRIDAFAMREPYVGEAKRLLGDGCVVFADPGLYLESFNLVALRSVIQGRVQTVDKVLRALVQAERLARDDSGQAIRIVSRRLRIGEEDLAQWWSDSYLRIGLGEELLLNLEDVARWGLRAKLAGNGGPPNYLDLVDWESLQRVKPNAVTVVH